MLHFLIIRADRIGDAVITQVVIEALAKTVQCKIDVFVSNYSHKFYEDNPNIQNIFYCNVENKKDTTNYYKAVCSKTNYAAIFILQARRRLQELTLLNKNTIRIGFNLVFDKRISSKIFQWAMKVFYKFNYVNYNSLQHEALNMSKIIEVGLEKLGLPKLSILPDQCKLYSKQILKTVKTCNSIIINISGKPDEQKIILPSMLASLLLLLSTDIKIAIIAFTSDLPMVNDILTQLIKLNPGYSNIDIISENDIFKIASKINAFEYYIGADGGLLHIAAALGLKCVGLYNEKVNLLWHPWTPRQASLSSNISYMVSPVAVINALHKLGFSVIDDTK